MINLNPNETSARTQCRMIAEWLRKGLPLTSLQALKYFGCMRLASRIHDLRAAGMEIEMERVKTPSGKVVAQYRATTNNQSNINQLNSK